MTGIFINLGQNALYIQVYDSTFTKLVFPYPAFQAKYTSELPLGQSKTYQATAGQFRLLGPKEGDATGDFYFKMKNTLDPTDFNYDSKRIFQDLVKRNTIESSTNREDFLTIVLIKLAPVYELLLK